MPFVIWEASGHIVMNVCSLVTILEGWDERINACAETFATSLLQTSVYGAVVAAFQQCCY